MRVWRLVGQPFAETAFDGEGAARYSGRWNSRGVRVVYTADSLALATLELAVHLLGARVGYTAIEVEIPDTSIDDVTNRRMPRAWRSDEKLTRSLGDRWFRSSASLAYLVPSALVDTRSGERNVLINATHPRTGEIVELQRFQITIDARL